MTFEVNGKLSRLLPQKPRTVVPWEEPGALAAYAGTGGGEE